LVDCTCISAARLRYFGVDTLKDVFENIAPYNIIALVKDLLSFAVIYNVAFTLPLRNYSLTHD